MQCGLPYLYLMRLPERFAQGKEYLVIDFERHFAGGFGVCFKALGKCGDKFPRRRKPENYKSGFLRDKPYLLDRQTAFLADFEYLFRNLGAEERLFENGREPLITLF